MDPGGSAAFWSTQDGAESAEDVLHFENHVLDAVVVSGVVVGVSGCDGISVELERVAWRLVGVSQSTHSG